MSNSAAQIRARYANNHHDIERIAIELMPSEPEIPIPSKGSRQQFAIRLALFYVALFGLIGTHLPFFPVWLKAIGIEASWIGVITAIPAVTRFSVLPFVTNQAGRRYSLRGAMILTAFVTALGFVVLGTQRETLLVFAVFAVTASMWTPIVPLTDAYALRGVATYGLNYGPLRLWGSAAFVVGALGCGLLVDVIATRHLIWVIASVAGLGAIVSLGLEPIDGARTRSAELEGPNRLLRDGGFLAIIVSATLIQGSHAAYYTFASITWQNAGLSGLTIAGLWALGVLAEIVVFAFSPRFTSSPAALVLVGGASAVVRWIITAQEPSLAVLSAVQVTHGLTFGLTQLGTMGLLVRNVPTHVMARGQGYLAACGGIIASSASVLSGPIYGRYGHGVYYLMAGMALCGALIIWLARKRLNDYPHSAASGG
jgi:MFS transporter, PPP family, 3-phenylpropionic acid transporter